MRKTFLAMAATAMVLVAACGAEGSTGGAAVPDAAAAAPGSRASETITLATASLPPMKGNPFYGSESPAVWVNGAIYDPLVKTRADGTLEPRLATAWTQLDARTWNFTLRDGVTFSDGSPLTAQGVADVLSFFLSEEGKSLTVAGILGLESVRAVDETTLEIVTKTASPTLPALLDEAYIPSATAFAAGGEEGLSATPVGTGPFVVSTWADTRVDLVANPQSWRAPIVGNLVVQVLPDQAARFQALQSGQADIAIALSPDQTGQLTEDVGRADVVMVPQVMSLAFDTESPTAGPLTDPRVRRALNHAVDKQAIADNLLLGRGGITGQGAIEGVVGFNPDVEPYAYDPDRARALLAEAGYPDGFALNADVVVGTFANDAQIYQQAAADLADVGVRLTLTTVPFSDWLPKFLSGDWGVSTAFGASWNGYPTLDPSTAYKNFSCLKPSGMFFCDRPTADVLAQALAEPDLAARDRRFQEVGALMNANPPALWLVSQIDIAGVSSAVQGFENNLRSVDYAKLYK